MSEEKKEYNTIDEDDMTQNETEEIFKKTQDLNKYLIYESVIQKEDNIYKPTAKYKDLFILDKYQGKIKGIKFKNEFISWIEKHIKEDRKPQQASLF